LHLQKCAYQAKFFLAKPPEQILYGGLLRKRLKSVGPVKRLNGFASPKLEKVANATFSAVLVKNGVDGARAGL